jgi:hypothetical protein
MPDSLSGAESSNMSSIRCLPPISHFLFALRNLELPCPPAAAAVPWHGNRRFGRRMVKVGGEQWMLALSLPPSPHEFQMNVTFTHTHTQTDRQKREGRTDRSAETDRKHTRYRHGYADRCRQELWKPGLCVRSAGPGVGGGFVRVRGGRAGHRVRGRRALTQSHTDSLAPPAVQSPPRAAKEKLAALSAASRKLFRPTA